jgi:glycosyltransferase involved in cell wall biosynthesis
MPDSQPLPLITFALFAYNQEKFVSEAVQGALNQDYANLEIILSDDFSSDNTGAIIRKMADDYCGPHKVIVNQNHKNMGLARHINTVLAIAKGELIVVGAGDDISRNIRTRLLVDSWLANGRPAAMCSSYQLIDENGAEIADSSETLMREGADPYEKIEKMVEFIKTGLPALVGPTQAWSRKLVDAFPPLRESVWFEDKAMSFRAMLAGEIFFIDERLVQYRRHENNIANRKTPSDFSVEYARIDEERKIKWLNRWVAVMDNYLQDLADGPGVHGMSVGELDLLRKEIILKRRSFDVKATWWNAGMFSRISAVFSEIVLRRTDENYSWMIVRCLPRPIFIFIQYIRLRFSMLHNRGGTKKWYGTL